MFRVDQRYQPVTLEQLALATTPEGTETFRPVPHYTVVNSVLSELSDRRVTFHDPKIYVHEDEMFAFVPLARPGEDYQLHLGIRNTHNKRFPLGVAIGSEVMVCSNLAFSGTQELRVRHTKRVSVRLETAIPQIIASVPGMIEIQTNTYKRLHEVFIDKDSEQRFLLQAAADCIIPQNRLRAIVDEVNAPRFEDFRSGTLWDFYNNMTTPLQGDNFQTLWTVSEQLFQRVRGMI